MSGATAFKHILMEASYKIPFRPLRRVRDKVWTRPLGRLVGEVCRKPLSRLYQQVPERQPPSFLFLPGERKASRNGSGETKVSVQGFRRGGSSGSTRARARSNVQKHGQERSTNALPFHTHLPKPFPCRETRIICLLFQHIVFFISSLLCFTSLFFLLRSFSL